MTEKSSYILTGGRVVDPSRNIDEIMDIGVQDGMIVDPAKISSSRKIDLDGLVVAPGFIDMHVHLRQPGNTAAETIRTGTMAAAAGGFTAVVAMPNTNPVTDTAGAVEFIRRQSLLEGVVKVLPCGAMTKGSEGKEMAGIGSLKRAGVVAISDDGKCIQNHEIMRHVVEYSKSFGLPILDHCEDEIVASNGVMHDGYWSTVLGMKGYSSAAEEMMVARDIILSRMSDWKIHVQHVSAKESVDLIRNAQRKGIKISTEVTPHHLALTDDWIKHFDTNYKMNPPLRTDEDRLALIDGLVDGTIAAIASDHAPHTETNKLVEFDYAPFGIIGLETSVSICFSELYHTGLLGLSQLISKYTEGPAKILDLDMGSLAEGKSADITIIDIDNEYVIDARNFYSKSRNTPFDGRKVKGKVVATVVDGKFVFDTLANR